MTIKFIRAKSLPAADAPHDGAYFGLRANWDERFVTAVAASAAIMVVATVAILMGMA